MCNKTRDYAEITGYTCTTICNRTSGRVKSASDDAYRPHYPPSHHESLKTSPPASHGLKHTCGLGPFFFYIIFSQFVRTNSSFVPPHSWFLTPFPLSSSNSRQPPHSFPSLSLEMECGHSSGTDND